jgi:histidinol-phosphate phosphatase family protein
VVDDRRDRSAPLVVPAGVRVVSGRAAGPAAARNAGWRAGSAEWVAFLDDDVVPAPGWYEALQADLAAADFRVGGSQGNVIVPLPRDRRPTDHERDVAALATGAWITADMAYRRAALAAVGGFDERFPRPYREDADLAARVRAAGWRLERGARETRHPVGAADRWISVRRQAGNADDVLLRALYGPRWRDATEVPPGRRPRHLAITGAALAAVVAAVAGRRRIAVGAAAAWLAGTAELTWARVAPGPKTSDEVATMLATSVLIPPAAAWHWLAGWATLPRRLRRRPGERPAAVLFDRDGTLIADVAYNGDPARVVPLPGARRALRRLRSAGIPMAVISNQSGVARGLLTEAQVAVVNRRVEDLLGPIGPWLVCPHGPDDGCGCRKPASGLVRRAAELLAVEPCEVCVIGDIGADVEAARGAGARSILVPTAATRADEVGKAPEVVATIGGAVDMLLEGR